MDESSHTGNEGGDLSRQFTTGQVDNPATCKNVVAVGAAGNYVPSRTSHTLLGSGGEQVGCWGARMQHACVHHCLHVWGWTLTAGSSHMVSPVLVSLVSWCARAWRM